MGYLIRYRTWGFSDPASAVPQRRPVNATHSYLDRIRTAPPAKSLISLEFFLGVRSHIKGAQNYCINEQVNCYTLLQ
jgi:hypothetical protein